MERSEQLIKKTLIERAQKRFPNLMLKPMTGDSLWDSFDEQDGFLVLFYYVDGILHLEEE